LPALFSHSSNGLTSRSPIIRVKVPGMKHLRASVFALMLGAAWPSALIVPAHAQVAIDVSVEIPPPPLPFYEQPVIPAEGYIWVPGYWAWDPVEGDYYWVPGTWVEPPQPELLWTPAYWGWDNGRYLFHPGYWGREIGFYGGIDYGYGYTGEGYYGGHWDHGVFFYNRTVNNITNVRITNVYNQTVVVNNTVNRVSFNGGNGGTAARPTPQQEAIARERHVEATPVQRQHAEAASKDRALFAKQNHGEPAVAATPRPGVMQGAGVTHGSRTPVNMNAAEPARESVRPEELQRPGQQPRPAEMGREAPKVEEPRRLPQEEPKMEAPRPPAQEPRPEMNREPPRPEPRAEPPKIEERRPMEERPMAPPPRAAEPPRPPQQQARPPAMVREPPRPAPHPPAEERK